MEEKFISTNFFLRKAHGRGTQMGENSSAVLALVQSLAPAVAYKESNLETNRKIWNLYAKVHETT